MREKKKGRERKREREEERKREKEEKKRETKEREREEQKRRKSEADETKLFWTNQSDTTVPGPFQDWPRRHSSEQIGHGHSTLLDGTWYQNPCIVLPSKIS